MSTENPKSLEEILARLQGQQAAAQADRSPLSSRGMLAGRYGVDDEDEDDDTEGGRIDISSRAQQITPSRLPIQSPQVADRPSIANRVDDSKDLLFHHWHQTSEALKAIAIHWQTILTFLATETVLPHFADEKVLSSIKRMGLLPVAIASLLAYSSITGPKPWGEDISDFLKNDKLGKLRIPMQKIVKLASVALIGVNALIFSDKGGNMDWGKTIHVKQYLTDLVAGTAEVTSQSPNTSFFILLGILGLNTELVFPGISKKVLKLGSKALVSGAKVISKSANNKFGR